MRPAQCLTLVGASASTAHQSFFTRFRGFGTVFIRNASFLGGFEKKVNVVASSIAFGLFMAYFDQARPTLSALPGFWAAGASDSWAARYNGHAES